MIRYDTQMYGCDTEQVILNFKFSIESSLSFVSNLTQVLKVNKLRSLIS